MLRLRLAALVVLMCIANVMVGVGAAVAYDGDDAPADERAQPAGSTTASSAPTTTTSTTASAPATVASTSPTTAMTTTSASSTTTGTGAAPTTTRPRSTVPPTTARPTPTTAPPTTARPTSSGTCASTVLALVNQARANAGVGALTNDLAIAHVPLNWSNHMAGTGQLAHNPNYAAQISAVHPDMAGWAENVAYFTGTTTPTEAGTKLFNQWMASAGHKRNILAASFTHTSIACVVSDRTTWSTQNFWNR